MAVLSLVGPVRLSAQDKVHWPTCFAWLWFALAVAAYPALAGDLAGKVVGVSDGDTLTLLGNGRDRYRVRLAEIDAPEGGQPYGRNARRMLSDLAYGKQVSVRVVDVDRFGRYVGRIRADGVDVNAEMVKRGAAWAYRAYLSDQRFLMWEQEARRSKRGLWGLQSDQIMAPWEWRAARRRSNPVNSPPSSLAFVAPTARSSKSNGLQCGTRFRCGEMRSCEEAMFHMLQCGLNRLDGDNDGVPCEKLCR